MHVKNGLSSYLPVLFVAYLAGSGYGHPLDIVKLDPIKVEPLPEDTGSLRSGEAATAPDLPEYKDGSATNLDIKVGEKKSLADLDPKKTYPEITVSGTLNCDKVDRQSLRVGNIIVKKGGLFNCTILDNSKVLKLEFAIGNKTVLVQDGGTISLAGAKRVSWSRLVSTAKKGDTSLVLPPDATDDWQVGDEIAIAPTDYSFDEYDVVKIVGKKDKKLIIDPPLKYRHFAQPQTFHDKTIEMRAEVALLTRNIKLWGDRSSEDDLKGATIKVAFEGSRGYFEDIVTQATII